MKIVRIIRNQIIFTAVVCVAGYVAYQVMLDDEAKEQLKGVYRTFHNSYDQISGIVNDRIGTIMDEDLVSQNRQNIRNAWENLGY